MELAIGKVPSSTEKGKDRKKPKEEEGDRFGRDKKRKGKRKKNRPEKTEETGSASTGERQHQQFSHLMAKRYLLPTSAGLSIEVC